jgi:hypothetical protein
LSFADRDDNSSEHYFIMDRSEDSPVDAEPDMENVYIERDDQQWGGFGGIERVVLHRNSLTLFLSPRMAKQMGEHDSIRIEFATNQHEFREMQHVLGLIMRGYESQLKLLS